MKTIFSLLILFGACAAQASTVVVLDHTGTEPKRVLTVTEGVPASVCHAKNAAHCIADPDLSAVADVRRALWVYDEGTGTIRKGTRAELVANGFDDEATDADQTAAVVKSLLQFVCSKEPDPAACRRLIRRRTTD